MANARIFQLMESASPGDGVYNMAEGVNGWLAERGYQASILARHVAPALRKKVASYDRTSLGPGDVLLYHFALSADASDFMRAQKAAGACTMMLYHNMTPPRFYRHEDPMLYEQLRKGRKDLSALRDSVDVTVAMSEYSKSELISLGYPEVRVVPAVVLDEKYEVPADEDVIKKWSGTGTNILFVGRLAPNKKQEDVIKTFYYYKRLNPSSSLLLVGAFGPTQVYYRWLRDLVEYLDLEDVFFAGHVSQAQLNAYYKVADVFLCMSEHEGFGVPLIESMHFGVPVIAYKAAAIPETMGTAGVLIRRKDFPVVAEVINMAVSDQEFRQGLVAAQKRRVESFRKEAVQAAFWNSLSPLLDGKG